MTKTLIENMGEMLMEDLESKESKEVIKEEVSPETRESFDSLLENLGSILVAIDKAGEVKKSLKALNENDIISTQDYRSFLKLADELDNMLSDASAPAIELSDAIEIVEEGIYDRFKTAPDAEDF